MFFFCAHTEGGELTFSGKTIIDFAHKTGDLPQIEHDVGIFDIEDKKIIVVVMTKNFENRDEIELNNKVGEFIYNFIKEWNEW